MTRSELLNIRIDEITSEDYLNIKNIIDELPKPIGGLGKFEDMICKIGCAQHTNSPDVSKKSLVIMCADNGIIEEGVAEEGGYVTGVVANKIANNEAAICLVANEAGVEILPIDIGINGEQNNPKLINKKVANGTNNFLREPAMTEEELLKAIEIGISTVAELKNNGTKIICTGEMGIGNSTTASSVICAIIEGDPNVLTGRGIDSISDSYMARKIDIICEGLHKYGYDLNDFSYAEMGGYDADGKEADRVLDIVKNLGGLDIAGLIGVFIGGAVHHIPVVVDGVVSSAAALAADIIIPGCRKYCMGSHFTNDVATELVFQELELDALMKADLTMGEGTGAVMIMPMLDIAMKVFNELGAFDSVELKEFE